MVEVRGRYSPPHLSHSTDCSQTSPPQPCHNYTILHRQNLQPTLEHCQDHSDNTPSLRPYIEKTFSQLSWRGISDISGAVELIIITLARLIKITTTRHAPYFMIQSAEMLGVVGPQCFMQSNITQPTVLQTSFIAFKYPVIAHLD